MAGWMEKEDPGRAETTTPETGVRIIGYRFGPFLVDLSRQQLFRAEIRVNLRRKAFEMLVLLVEHQGRLLSKEEISASIWGERKVEEGNISQCVYTLRQVLEDDRQKGYIKTIPGEGYVFAQPVKCLTDGGVQEVSGGEGGVEVMEMPPSMGVPGAKLPDTEEIAESGRIGAASLLLATISAPVKMMSGWRLPAKILIGLVMFLAVVTVGAALTGWLPVSVAVWSEAGSESLSIVSESPFVTLPGVESSPAFSPDGKRLAFASEGSEKGNIDIYIKPVDDVAGRDGTPAGGEVRITSHPEIDHQPVWSPDGRYLAFLRKNNTFGNRLRLIVVPSEGGEEREVAMVWGGLDWSPDGKYLLVSDSDESTGVTIFLVSVDGRERRRVIPNQPYLGTRSLSHDNLPRFSPDGKKVAFVRWEGEPSADIYVAEMETGNLIRVTSERRSIFDINWSRDGKSLFFLSNRAGRQLLWQVPAKANATTAIRPVGNLLMEMDSCRFSPDGERMAYTQSFSDTEIIIGPTDGTPLFGTAGSGPELPCRISSSRSDDSARFSNDGRRIAFASNRSGWDEIWTVKADCSEARQLTNFREIGVGSPRWSPDDSFIVFDRRGDKQSDVYTIGIDGNNLRRITISPTTDCMGSWSRNGQWIYYTCDRISSYSSIKHTCRIAKDGSNSEEQVTTNSARDPLESSDGRFLYFTNTDRLWQKDLISGVESAVPELAEVEVGRHWDVTSRAIYYLQINSKGGSWINRFDLTTKRIRRVAEYPERPPEFVPGISVSPDEKKMAVSYVGYRGGDIIMVRIRH